MNCAGTTRANMGDSSVGGSEVTDGGGSGVGSRELSARLLKIKKSLNDFAGDNDVLSRLKEKIRQQRLYASSTDTSQNESVVSDLPQSDASRDGTPQHTVREADVSKSGEPVAGTRSGRMSGARKAAVKDKEPSGSHPSSSSSSDSHPRTTAKHGTQTNAPKKRSRSCHKSSDPVHKAIRAQLKAHGHLSTSLSSIPSQPVSTSTPNGKAGESWRREVGKKPLKPGANHVITTSSWRVGQELIARELGLGKVKNKGSSSRPVGERRNEGGKGHTSSNTVKVTSTGISAAKQPSEVGRDSSVSALRPQPTPMCEDSNRVFSDLLLEKGDKGSARPAVKRKAAKPEVDAEKPEPAEKQRHYDSESVRQFMARQKAERQRQREEARQAEEQDRRKRHQLMQELISKQKWAATSSPPAKQKKVKQVDQDKMRQSVLSSAELHKAHCQRVSALLGEGWDRQEKSCEDKEGEGEEDHSDADTLTADSEEGSTPRASAGGSRETGGRVTALDYNDNKCQPISAPSLGNPISAITSTASSDSSSPVGGKPLQFQGKTLNMDVNSVLSRFSQVVSQRQAQEGGPEGRGSSSVDKRRQERLQTLRSSSQDLQSKIANASAEMNSHPGAQKPTSRAGSKERTAASTALSSLKDQASSGLIRASTPITVPLNQGQSGDGKTRTSLSTEPGSQDKGSRSSGKASSQKETEQDTGGFVMDVQYRAPTAGNQRRVSPHSATNTISSSAPSQRPAAAGGGRERGSSSSSLSKHNPRNTFPQPSSTRPKNPRVGSAHTVSSTQHLHPHPHVPATSTSTTTTALSRPTRPHSQFLGLERQQGAQRARNRTSRSEERLERIGTSTLPPRLRSTSQAARSPERDEEDTRRVARGSLGSSLPMEGSRHLLYDTDRLQVDEDETPHSDRSLDHSLDTSQQECGDPSWSPEVFERQMAVEMARLENLEESIRLLSSAERTQAIALAHKETVSVAQVLKAGQQAHSAELRSLQQQVQEERLASAQQLEQQLGGDQGSQQLMEQVDNRRPDTKLLSSASGDGQLTSTYPPALLSSTSRDGDSAKPADVDRSAELPETPSEARVGGDDSTINISLSEPSTEDSFKRFTEAMVHNILQEEELSARYQEAVLKLRVKAVKEKTLAQLALLSQERRQLEDEQVKAPDHRLQQQLRQLAQREQVILQQQEQNQGEIERLFKSEELAREQRHSLLKQHQHFAHLQEETQEKMKQLQGRLDLQVDGHAEGENSVMEDFSDISDLSISKDYAHKDTETGNRQPQLQLDQKFLTVREQKLKERRKQASELLRWKRDLDAEEAKVLQLERTALQAWEGRSWDKPQRVQGTGTREGAREEAENKVKAPGNLRPEPGTPRSARPVGDAYLSFNASETTPSRSRPPGSLQDHHPADESESERRGPGIGKLGHTGTHSGQEEEDGDTLRKGRKSPVGRLLPPGNSPLPQPWSHKTGSESESEESMSHTETQSDVSDYEVRIRQLSDMLRRRRKEADMLKKERSKRMKEKMRAQEESLKKQLEAYEIFISQVKTEQADLEQEGGKPAVPPKIKQPGPSTAKSATSPSVSPPPVVRHEDSSSAGMAAGEALLVKSPTTNALADNTKDKVDYEHSQLRPPQHPSRQDNRKGRSEKSAIPRSISADGRRSVSPGSSSNIPKSGSGTVKDAEPSVARNDNASLDDRLLESGTVAKKQSRIPVRSDASPPAGSSSTMVNKPHASALPSLDSKSGPVEEAEVSASISLEPIVSSSSRPATGIQESDSESESRLNSHRTHSRPSSERSTGSTTFSDLHDFDEEEEEDLISSESERTPNKDSTPQRERLSSAGHSQNEEDVEVVNGVPLAASSDLTANNLSLGDEDATPTHTPRSGLGHFEQEEAAHDFNSLTERLTDFHVDDPVLVWDRMPGTLRFKGPVHFAKGLWAGVELYSAEGDTDGMREGQRYFRCRPDHGLLVPASAISAQHESVSSREHSPDMSVMSQEDTVSEREKPRQGRQTSPSRKTPDLDALADDLSADLSLSVTEDSVTSSAKTTSTEKPTPSKPAKSRIPQKKPASKLQTSAKPQQTETAEETDLKKSSSVLDSAVSEVVQLWGSRIDPDSADSTLVSSSCDSGVYPSHDSSMDGTAVPSAESPLEGSKADGLHASTSHRPRSPAPADSAAQQEAEDYEFCGLAGDDDFFEDDDFGLSSAKTAPPPPYPSSAGSLSSATDSSEPLSPAPTSKSLDTSSLFLVPHERPEVEDIVKDALSIYWNLRRCGESWDSVTPPEEFLAEQPSDEAQHIVGAVSDSRRSFRQLLFDLTGDIVRDIYRAENEAEPPPWQKAAARRQRYFKGHRPPSTVEVLLPVVQNSVVDLLGLVGCSGRHRGPVANKWSVRKKKDHVDAVLVEELQEEEADWINYDRDEVTVKMQLTDTLLESLLADTVSTLNRIYTARQQRLQAS